LTLTADQLEQEGQALRRWREAFAALGHDGDRAAALVLDGVDLLESPVLNLGSGMSAIARELTLRGLVVESHAAQAEDPDVAALPFPDGAFASAVSFNVLHHVGNGASVLCEIVRVVRPGGLLLLVDFSREGFDIAARVLSAEGGVHPEGPVTLDWARGFLAGSGLAETRVGEVHHERFATFRTPGSPPKDA